MPRQIYNMTRRIYDAIVIGGGPAGSTVATTLAKEGHDVLVLEKEHFPRDHVGESLLPFCYDVFEDLGVLDTMKQKFARKPGVTFSNIDGSDYSNWCFSHVIKDERYLSFHVRRAPFDKVLLDNASASGADVREGCAVKKVNFGSHLQTVFAEGEGGATEYKGRHVVDASGQSSFLARQLKCKHAYDDLNVRIAFSSHWSGIHMDESLRAGNIKIIHLGGEKLGWLWLIPLEGDRLSIGVAVNMDYYKSVRKDAGTASADWQTEFYVEEIKSSPYASKIVNGAHMIQRVEANSDFSYYAKDKYNDKYTIVGDASAFLDPIFSSGIYLALKGGQLVGKGLHALLEDGQMDQLDKAYVDIAGAYKLVKRLIQIFYAPDSIRFSGADKAFNLSYEKFSTAYSILHLILAGDFFSNHEKYLEAIEVLRDPKMIKKYQNLIGHQEVRRVDHICT